VEFTEVSAAISAVRLIRRFYMLGLSLLSKYFK